MDGWDHGMDRDWDNTWRLYTSALFEILFGMDRGITYINSLGYYIHNVCDLCFRKRVMR